MSNSFSLKSASLIEREPFVPPRLAGVEKIGRQSLLSAVDSSGLYLFTLLQALANMTHPCFVKSASLIERRLPLLP